MRTSAPDPPPEFSYQVLRKTVTRTVTLNYLLRVPSDYTHGSRWPMVIYLHGAGEKGDDLQAITRSALPRVVNSIPNFPFWLVCPQCPEQSGWSAVDLAVLLDGLTVEHPIDPERVYMTGVSMGGRGTWEFAYAHADRLAAIVPVCGFGIPTLVRYLKNLPIWTFHGAQDDILPVARSDEMVAALEAIGNSVRYTRYPDEGHNCGQRAYLTPDLWPWLAQQRHEKGK